MDNNRKKVELQVLNITNSQEQAGAYAMILGEVDGIRQLPVIIGASEAQAMLIEMKGVIPPRPLTHNLFASVLEVLHVMLMRVLIYKVENGVYYTYLYLKADETILRIDARTSDAVVLSLRMAAPILIYDDILEEQCMKNETADATPADKKTRTLNELKAALQEAIGKEDYEAAATLRDKINRYSNNQ